MSRGRMFSLHASRDVRTLALLISALTAATPTQGQTPRPVEQPPESVRMLGLSVAASGGPRDTLGLLIAAVTRDGPADQAGITPGSRILAVNGALVRLAPSEIGRRGAADSALTHFDRVLRETAGATDVTLRIVGGGRLRTVSLPATGARRDAPRAGPITPVRDTVVPASATVQPSMVVPASSPAIGSVLESLAAAQVELRRMAGETHDIALSDTLAELDDALSGVRRRLRSLTGLSAPVPAAPAASAPPAPAVVTPLVPAMPSPVRIAVNGLELTTASADLSAYLGASAETALVVLQASEQWDPLRAGDVVTQVDGAEPDALRLRSALESRAPVTLTVRRRGRTFTVSFGSETR